MRVGRPTRIRPEASGRWIHLSGEVSVREVGPTTGKASSGFPGEAFSVGALDERGGSRCLNLLSFWELHILSCARTPLCQACGGHCTWQGGCAKWSCSSCSECPFGCYEAICSPFNRERAASWTSQALQRGCFRDAVVQWGLQQGGFVQFVVAKRVCTKLWCASCCAFLLVALGVR